MEFLSRNSPFWPASTVDWTREARSHPRGSVAVGAAGHVGELAEGVGLKFGKDDGAAVVFDEAVLAVGDHSAGGGADAEREDADVLLLSSAAAAFQVSSVASPSERTMRKRSADPLCLKAARAVWTSAV